MTPFWKRDRELAHVPVGWRQAARDVLSVAAEHAIAVSVAVRWAAEPHPHSPTLMIIEQGVLSSGLPVERVRVQFLGRAQMDRITVRARALCMSCGTAETAPTHVALWVDGRPYIAMLCSGCAHSAALDGYDFWSSIGRFDPLLADWNREDGLFGDEADDREGGSSGEFGDDDDLGLGG